MGTLVPFGVGGSEVRREPATGTGRATQGRWAAVGERMRTPRDGAVASPAQPPTDVGSGATIAGVAMLARIRSLLIMIGADSTSRRCRVTLNWLSLR